VSDPRLSVLPPLPPSVYLRRPSPGPSPFPLGEPDVALFSFARHGIYVGLRRLGLPPGDEALVPAYHHGSEVEALVRAGLRCRFYEGTERLEPDEEELEGLLGPSVRLLHLTHYLGFPQDTPRWRSWCDEHGLLLLEDAAQAWLATLPDGRPAGSLGDIAVFSLYKTVGVPGGAALHLRAPPQSLSVPAADGLGVRETARRHASWLFSRSGAFSRLAHRRTAPYDATRDFALGDPGRRPLGLTLRLLPRLAAHDAVSARRANYRRLLEALGEHVRPPFDELPEGASPFCLAVETEHKAEVLSRLDHEGIAATDFWSVPHPSLPAECFPESARRRSRAIGLPVHQELRGRDVERIANVAAAVLGATR
jgi:dTDP-4-amino-4,6-dideoxygalactose transaminase